MILTLPIQRFIFYLSCKQQNSTNEIAINENICVKILIVHTYGFPLHAMQNTGERYQQDICTHKSKINRPDDGYKNYTTGNFGN